MLFPQTEWESRGGGAGDVKSFAFSPAAVYMDVQFSISRGSSAADLADEWCWKAHAVDSRHVNGRALLAVLLDTEAVYFHVPSLDFRNSEPRSLLPARGMRIMVAAT